MKDALIIFIFLLVLLLIISVFGGSVRPTQSVMGKVSQVVANGSGKGQWSTVPQPWNGSDTFANSPPDMQAYAEMSTPTMQSSSTMHNPTLSMSSTMSPPPTSASMSEMKKSEIEDFTSSVIPFSSDDKHAPF